MVTASGQIKIAQVAINNKNKLNKLAYNLIFQKWLEKRFAEKTIKIISEVIIMR
jgi:hypothetical protein